MRFEIELSLLILVLPLAAFVVQVFFGARLPRQGDWLPTGAMLVACVLSWYLFLTRVLGQHGGTEPITWSVTWLELGAGTTQPIAVDFGILFDNLTSIMLVVVTTVSFLVHLYSCGYMRDHHGHPEPRYSRFFAYLALFSFSMLLLVLTDNLFMLYMSWELVGVCSYFLIGFYFQKPSAANASMKAFLTTRVGDVGFFVGIMIVLWTVGSFGYAELFASVRPDSAPAIWGEAGSPGGVPVLVTVAALFLFCGAVGKSAQFPLHVWLPDAMEGPTPVSALIHAATMVAAGVYMVARLFPFFAGPPYWSGDFAASPALWVVAGVGALTAILAATIAIVQTDIKKVLAYSTISQLGYMMLGIGVGSFAAGMYHLWTHAWFKALLFLGAGSVIHAVHTNEMPEMGGLRRKLPVTFATMLVATMAIAGVPLLSGFFSKEAVLTQALAFGIYHGSIFALLPFLAGIATAAITAFYMFRLIFLTFAGEPRDVHRFEHAHENPPVITGPLVVLALLSIVGGGVLGLGEGVHWFEHRVTKETLVDPLMAAARYEVPAMGEALTPTLPHGERETPAHAFAEAHHQAHDATLYLSLFAATLGIGGACWVYGVLRGRDLVGQEGFLASYRKVLLNLYFIDWFYSKVFVGGLLAIRRLCGLFDKYVVDGLVNLAGLVSVVVSKASGAIDYWGVDGAVRGTADTILKAGDEARRVQTGRLQEYVYLSVVLIAFIFVVWTVAGAVL